MIELLDELVPPFDDAGDWDDVLRRARPAVAQADAARCGGRRGRGGRRRRPRSACC